MTVELTVSVETVYVSLPFLERAYRIMDRGLQVEAWDWGSRLGGLDELTATGVEMMSMTGHL